jgi:flagellar hook-length control protein FliK
LQESTNVTSAKTGTESEQKVADVLLTPQRAVNGAGEAAAAAKTGEAHHPKEPHADTLGQIVDKAVFRLRNGRSEVRIDLKPDSLGHVKLQIVTENHQVTLRIMAESHAAKNLIDSGIGQLKADLQAQGLRVDELEVSVANEFNDLNRHSAFSDDAAQARDRSAGLSGNRPGGEPETGDGKPRDGRCRLFRLIHHDGRQFDFHILPTAK